MNGNVATYSGTYMPQTSKRNLDLRLDLNLMNLNNNSTPCTPNGKIKVFMNNIATSVTKVKNSSTEWRRCRLDKDNCLSLESVLETFNSSISEEQAWAICFSFIRCIQKLTRKGFKFKLNKTQSSNSNNNLNDQEFILYLHKDGHVHKKTIFQLLNSQLFDFNELNCESNCKNELNCSNGLNDENCFMNGAIKELNEQEVNSLDYYISHFRFNSLV